MTYRIENIRGYFFIFENDNVLVRMDTYEAAKLWVEIRKKLNNR